MGKYNKYTSLDLTPADTVRKIESNLDYALFLSLETEMQDPEDKDLITYKRYARQLQCQLDVAKLLANLKEQSYG